jgi:hypothetical protein
LNYFQLRRYLFKGRFVIFLTGKFCQLKNIFKLLFKPEKFTGTFLKSSPLF